jgi:hypothetical protein
LRRSFHVLCSNTRVPWQLWHMFVI